MTEAVIFRNQEKSQFQKRLFHTIHFKAVFSTLKDGFPYGRKVSVYQKQVVNMVTGIYSFLSH